MATNLPPISIPTINTFRPTTNVGTAATANLQTGFTAANTFGAGQANFAALGAPDQAGSALQALTQVVTALKEIVSALTSLVSALKGGAPAENAQAKQPEGGAGGGEAAKTGTAAPKDDKGAEAAKEGGGGGEAAKAGGGGEAAKAGGAGGGAEQLMGQLPALLQSLMQILQMLQEQEQAKAEGGKGKGKKGGEAAKAGGGGEAAKAGGGDGTNASAQGKMHAAPNSKVGQQAMMEKMNQALVQVLGALLQMLGSLVQQVAGQLQPGNPEAQKALDQTGAAMALTGGGGARAGVDMAL